MKEDFSIQVSNEYKIIGFSNKINIIDSLSVFFEKSVYSFTGVTNFLDVIKYIKNEHFDILILDSITYSDDIKKIIKKVREFNKDIYILLASDNKDLSLYSSILKGLDIQSFCDKSNDFEQLSLFIKSAINSITQMNEIKQINFKLFHTYNKLEDAYLDFFKTINSLVESKDTYTKWHSDRVAKISVLIGKKMNLSEDDLKILYIGGLFHDIGKIGIPDTILLKETKLTDYEYSQIKSHISIGNYIFNSADIFKDILPIIKYHHEKYDGTGYPSNLNGINIPLMARIVAIADSFDAMISKRVYSDALSMDIVKDEIKRCSGTQFDPEIAKIFLDILINEYDKIQEIQEKYVG